MTRRSGFVPVGALCCALSLISSAATAQHVLQAGTKDLATQIAARVSKQQKRAIAVVPFRELDGSVSALSTFLAEELTTSLFDVEGITIVERTLLDRVLGELKLGATGAIDPTTAKQIGKILGADALVTGTVTDLTSVIAVNSRLIDTGTGAVFAVAQVRIVKDDDVKKLLGISLASPRTPSSPSGEGRPTGPPAPLQRGTADGFSFELESCRATAGGIECLLTVVNEREDYRLRLDGDSRFFDQSGSEFQASRLFVGTQETRKFGQGVTVVSKVRTPARILFENVRKEVTHMALLELKGYARKWYTVQFRNVVVAQ
jgi:TolB-like protein